MQNEGPDRATGHVPSIPLSASGLSQAREEEIGGIIDGAQRAAERRDWSEAGRCWDAVRSQFPDHAPAYPGAADALREMGRYDEAEQALGDGAERFPDNEAILVARAWLANRRQDWPTALSRWEAARASFPDNPSCYLGNIEALQGAGRADQVRTLLGAAEAALAAAKQRDLDAMIVLRLELEIAKARLDWPAVQQAAEEIAANQAAPSAQVLLALAQACWNNGNLEAADRAALRALAVDPKLTEAIVVRVRIAVNQGNGETALSCYRALVELDPGTIRWSLKFAQLLHWFGYVKEARAEFENIRRRWPNDATARALLRIYAPAPDEILGGDPDQEKLEIQAITEKAPGPAEYLRPLMVDDPDGDVFLAERKGAETAVLIFTGGRDTLSLPLQLFDRYLATLNLTAIYLKDFNRLWYLSGVQSLGRDYQGTLAALRDRMSRLGVKRLCTIGNCFGGFASIRYGVDLGAERILTFEPFIYGPRESWGNNKGFRNFMGNRLDANVPRDIIDLKAFLETSRHTAKIEIYYVDEEGSIRTQSLQLSGLPGVTLHAEQGLSHQLLRQMVLSHQDFRGMLGDLLGVGPAATSG